MTSLIRGGDVVCQPVPTLKAVVLNKSRPTNFSRNFVTFLCFYAKNFTADVKKRCFLILHGGVLTHA